MSVNLVSKRPIIRKYYNYLNFLGYENNKKYRQSLFQLDFF